MLVQGWATNMVQKWTGTYRGQQAGSEASAIGYLAGCSIWLDWEVGAWESGTTAKECFTWIDDWAAAIRSAGYAPGIYVGETTGKPLDSSQLGSWNSVNSGKRMMLVSACHPLGIK